jgi:hypothetical protein
VMLGRVSETLNFASTVGALPEELSAREPSRSELKTSRRPSGVQTGFRSRPESDVKRDNVSRDHSYTHISWFPFALVAPV